MLETFSPKLRESLRPCKYLLSGVRYIFVHAYLNFMEKLSLNKIFILGE